MSSLPVAVVLPELLAALEHAPQVLLSAPTGAGKSTWLLYLGKDRLESDGIAIMPCETFLRQLVAGQSSIDEKGDDGAAFHVSIDPGLRS